MMAMSDTHFTKEAVADHLLNIAQLLELLGENPFKIRAYQNAAHALEVYTGDLYKTIKTEDGLESIEGIGKSVATKITELLQTGKIEYYETLQSQFPPTIFELFTLPGLGPKKVKALYEALHISSIAELETACQSGAIASLPKFGKKTEQNLLAAIAYQKQSQAYFRLGDVAAESRLLIEAIREIPEVSQVSEAGSRRRRREIVHDLDVVVATKNPTQVRAAFAQLPMVVQILSSGEKKVSLRLTSGISCDIRLVTTKEYPFTLHHFTGSKEHNIALRQRALHQKGWSLSEYGITPVDSPTRPRVGLGEEPIQDEADFYKALGLAYIPPELRENTGEIEAAEKNEIPQLVELTQLRGTFHNHTTESDGHNTLEEMAEAARELGLEYLGIADHSKSSFQAHGLDSNRLLAQKKQIDALNQTYQERGIHFRIFAGVECDILRDGSMDFPDEILAQLDYVVGSVHNVFSLPEAEMTARIIRAIENPYVTMIGHLTGRLLLRREPYAVNIPAVIDAAAANDTILEINANPHRLDMDWRWWKLAKSKNVRCSINPDAHSTQELQNLWYGVAVARKGWLTAENIINCCSLKNIAKELTKKRP